MAYKKKFLSLSYSIKTKQLKHIMEQLTEKLKLYEFIFDNLNAWVYVNHPDGPVWMNKKAQDDLGMSPDELKAYGIEKYAKDFYHPDDINLFQESIEYINNQNIENFNFIYRQKGKTNEYFKLLGSGRVIERTKEGYLKEIINCAIIVSDNPNDYTQLDQLIKENALLKSKLKISELSKRELQILRHIANGLTTSDISIKESISFHTVEAHRKKIMKKLEAKNLADIVRIAAECEIYNENEV